MRAQLDQVGKNIETCLEVAGARPSDIILTRAYVTDADAFKKNVDALARHLGPATPASSVSAVPNLPSGPDVVVEIEAVAAIGEPTAGSAGSKR